MPTNQPNTGAARGVAVTTSGPVTGFVTGTGEGEYCGITAYATGAGTILLYDNASAASGLLLETVEFTTSVLSVSKFYPRPARQVVNGVYAVVAGAVVAATIFQ